MIPLAFVLSLVLLPASVRCLATGRLAATGDDGPRIVSPEDRRAFYRNGGKAWLGKRIHLHVEATILRKKPKTIRGSDGSPRLLFENRSVPLVIDPGSPYWSHARRRLDDATEFCLHGTVRYPANPEEGERPRAHLFVDRLQRAPGSWQ